jgi:hypothetical protein
MSNTQSDKTVEEMADKFAREMAVMGLNNHGYSMSAMELTRQFVAALTARENRLVEEAKVRGKIEAVKYAMQFAEKDPEYVTWDFLASILSSYEAQLTQRSHDDE